MFSSLKWIYQNFILVPRVKAFRSSMSTLEAGRLVWMDMEMTGLNIDTDKIMEVACIITDYKLNIMAEGPHLILHQPDTILNSMNEWCTKHHGKSGLTVACRNSKISLSQAEDYMYNFLKLHINEKSSPLAGNSVYMDRLFLRKFMPRVDEYLHYRIIDVSTVKELCRFWNLSLVKSLPAKTFQHRALDDIKESIEELKFYRENFFKINEQS